MNDFWTQMEHMRQAGAAAQMNQRAYEACLLRMQMEAAQMPVSAIAIEAHKGLVIDGAARRVTDARRSDL